MAIDPPDRLKLGGIDALLREIAVAGDDANLRVGGSVIEQNAADFLNAALIGVFPQTRLTMTLGVRRIPWLEKTGLAFSLANRPGKTLVRGGESEDWKSDLTIDWAQTWSPSDSVRALPELFAPTDWGATDAVPDHVGGASAVFVNAHRSPASGARHPSATQVWPWLDDLVPRTGSVAVSSSARQRLLVDVGSFIDEAVGNITDHAVTQEKDTLSLLRVAVERGGGSVGARIHVSVLDTGPGIIATATAKAETPVDAESLLKGLFDGSISLGSSPGHGLGLPRILEATRKQRGTLSVWANSAVFEAGFSSKPILRSRRSGHELRGTVIHVSFPVE